MCIIGEDKCGAVRFPGHLPVAAAQAWRRALMRRQMAPSPRALQAEAVGTSSPVLDWDTGVCEDWRTLLSHQLPDGNAALTGRVLQSYDWVFYTL